MIKENYANAYKEVLIVLEKLRKEDYNKIPKEYIDFFGANCNKDYEFYYDNSKSFDEQDLLDDTKYILFGLFEKFGATELQKEKIKFFKNNYYNQLEIKKREKYNPENIFKKDVEQVITNKEREVIKSNTSLVKYKESLLSKIKKFLSNILHIHK